MTSVTGPSRDTLTKLLRDYDKRIQKIEHRRLIGGGGGNGGTPINEVEIGPTEPTDPNVVLWFDTTSDTLYALDNGQWVVAGGGGGTGDAVDEVYVGTTQPPDPTGVLPKLELWYDPDATLAPNYAYAFTQSAASSVWVINHPLQFRPNVTVTDSAGDQVEGTVTYTDADTITITFSAPFAGTAYLS